MNLVNSILEIRLRISEDRRVEKKWKKYSLHQQRYESCWEQSIDRVKEEKEDKVEKHDKWMK